MNENLQLKELDYLNREHVFPMRLLQGAASSTAPLGVFARFKNLVRSKLRRFLLGEYLSSQVEFQANLVRVLNELNKVRDSRLFTMDDYYRASLLSVEKQFQDTLQSYTQDLKQQIATLATNDQVQSSELKTLDAVTRGLERIIGRWSAPESSPENSLGNSEQAVPPQTTSPSYNYLLLENRYRGSEQEISERLLPYLTVFQNASNTSTNQKPILEIGSGRGELQQLFRNAEINSYGIEINRAMHEHCQQKTLDVRLENAISHLETLSDKSLAGLIAIQVVEHLPQQVLSQLLSLTESKVQKGGRVVIETINTESLVALGHNYFRDPSHIFPLHPDTMCYLMELAGLQVLEVRKLSPYPLGAMLQTIPVQDYMPPRWIETVNTLNRNFSQLNSLLYGYQDYCVIAQVER